MDKLIISDTCKLIAGNGLAHLYLEHHVTTGNGFTDIQIPDKYISTLSTSCYFFVRTIIDGKYYPGMIMPSSEKKFTTRYYQTVPGYTDMPKGASICGAISWYY